ncbi:ABC transporter ATP-binding protein [Streptomyces sp. WMMB 322]|uniref:ABC transporter ATP-binding protein n=1 Tax=Streptomyces sp. WMMB 322 TaxID=1286821 RepID=UPI000823D75B|nr:ABC transporter ATP-binding protein [Streptomyces sp. WMMB 322]SCK10569.1 putative ABC transport system ATP-binding protein [Streptomyces sp. WMMB 322]
MTTAVADPRSGGSGAHAAVAASARGLVKAYGSGETRVVALDHVDVDIARGAFTAIMGPSGSGKSTLMHCLAGLDSVSEGRIRIGEQEITGLKDKKLTKLRRDRIGFIFQAYNLLPTLNALENITLPMDIAGRKPDKEWLQTVIATVGLEERLKHRPTQLSGGQQQRVAVARALAARPEIIFGDEPTGNLDSRAGAEMLGFLRRSVDELRQTIVMVTHDPVAAAYADRVLYLADGRIVDEMYRPTAEAVLDKMLRLAESTDPEAVAQPGAAPAAGPAGHRTPEGLEAFGDFDDVLEDRADGSARGAGFDPFGANGSRP